MLQRNALMKSAESTFLSFFHSFFLTFFLSSLVSWYSTLRVSIICPIIFSRGTSFISKPGGFAGVRGSGKWLWFIQGGVGLGLEVEF